VETSVRGFLELTPQDAYAAWRLRQDVFVLEQTCFYHDLDGRDTEPGTRHVMLHDDAGTLIGYCRILDDADAEPPAWRIGRVVLARSVRGRGLADLVVRRALADCAERDAGHRPRAVVLDAQAPLAGWYATFGFEVAGPQFVEDGIPHVPMRLDRS